MPLETPAIESRDVLIGTDEGAEITKEIYAISRAAAEGDAEKESKRALRFDLTVPFARYVAEHYRELAFPFKRYQIQKVWRGERPQAGRFREFYQSDIDVIADGELPLFYDAEVVQIAHQIFADIGFEGFTIHINHRKLLQGVLEQYGVAVNQVTAALRIIDKLDKIGIEKTAALLQYEIGLEAGEDLLAFLSQKIMITEVDAFLDGITPDNDLLVEGIAEMREIASYLCATHTDRQKIVLNLGIARGLSYYTGCVYETTIDGFEQYGSMCSGGRYANLAERFIDTTLEGVGISIGLTRLLDVFMRREKMLQAQRQHVLQVMIVMFGEEQRVAAQGIAQQLRAANIAVDITHNGERKLLKQFKDIERRGISYALIINDDDTFELKDMQSRDQVKYEKLTDVIEELKK
jgi:histidyl-tRNA synthetase